MPLSLFRTLTLRRRLADARDAAYMGVLARLAGKLNATGKRKLYGRPYVA